MTIKTALFIAGLLTDNDGRKEESGRRILPLVTFLGCVWNTAATQEL